MFSPEPEQQQSNAILTKLFGNSSSNTIWDDRPKIEELVPDALCEVVETDEVERIPTNYIFFDSQGRAHKIADEDRTQIKCERFSLNPKIVRGTWIPFYDEDLVSSDSETTLVESGTLSISAVKMGMESTQLHPFGNSLVNISMPVVVQVIWEGDELSGVVQGVVSKNIHGIIVINIPDLMDIPCTPPFMTKVVCELSKN